MLQDQTDEQSSAVGAQDPLLGQRIGRYRLLRFIGAGGTGLVYAAWDESLERRVALKLVPKTNLVSWADVSPLLQTEARIAASLDHAHIVRVYEFGDDGGWCFLAMELLEGHNLKQLIGSAGAFDTVRACQIMADVADALAYAHREGVVHRDIKPANLILTRSGRCKITDFGLAAFHAARTGEGQERVRVGTASYMAPEVTLGRAAKPVSDIYSFGATLWHLLAGAPPHAGGDTQSFGARRGHVGCVPTDIAELRPDIPPPLAHVIGRCLAAEPAQRWSEIDDMARILRLYSVPLDEVSARSPEGRRLARALAAVLTQKTSRPSGRRLALGAGGVLAVAALTGAGAVTGLYQLELSQRRTAVLSLTGNSEQAAVFREFTETNRLQGLNWLAEDVTQVVSPADTEMIDALSRREAGPVIGVAGRVRMVSFADNRKVGWFTLVASATEDQLRCVFFPETFDAMSEAFGSGADRLIDRPVMVKGHVTRYQGRPQVVVTAPTQIVLLTSALLDPSVSHVGLEVSPQEQRP